MTKRRGVINRNSARTVCACTAWACCVVCAFVDDPISCTCTRRRCKPLTRRACRWDARGRGLVVKLTSLTCPSSPRATMSHETVARCTGPRRRACRLIVRRRGDPPLASHGAVGYARDGRVGSALFETAVLVAACWRFAGQRLRIGVDAHRGRVDFTARRW